MPLAGNGVRGKAAGLAPPQHTETRSTTSAPDINDNFQFGDKPAKWLHKPYAATEDLRKAR